MLAIGGFVLIVPAHATVIIFGFPSSSKHVTITTGNGFSIFPGLNSLFPISASSFFYKKVY
jgi:hypothetical protein